MTIKGAVGPDSGGFTVGLDPSNPLAYSGGDPFSANEQWFSPAVLYALPLDPAVQYHITVNSVDYVTLPNATEGTGSGVRLHSVTFYSAYVLSRVKAKLQGRNGQQQQRHYRHALPH